MSEFVVGTAKERHKPLIAQYSHLIRPALTALAVSIAYYVGAKVGLLLTFQPHPVSTLWPPNSILFAALLLSPRRWWWFILLAVFPAHLMAELHANVPATMILCWFVSNCSEALISASVLRYLAGDLRLDVTYGVWAFIFVSILGPFLSSFLDAGFVKLNGFGNSDYWDVFRMRFFSNVLASLTLVPLIVMWTRSGIAPLRNTRWPRYVEAGVLASGLLLVGIVSFATQRAGQNTIPALLYLPVPFLLWAATRFGPRGSSIALLAVSVFAIWGAINGIGPFATQSAEMNALSVQLFLILTSMPVLLLAALIKEREQAEEIARHREERFEMALEAAQMGTWDWRISEDTADWSAQTKRMFGLSPSDQEFSAEEFYSRIHNDDRTRVKDAVQRAIARGDSYEVEFRVPQKDGTVRWVRGVGKVIVDDSGRPSRMTGVNLDVTERRLALQKLHETSERNRAMLRALPDMVFLMSTDGLYLDYHAREPKRLLVSPADFMGKSVRHVLPKDLADKVMDCLAKTTTSEEPQILEYSLILDGEHRHYEARLIGMDGSKALSIVRDVTDRQRAARALRDSQEKLHHSHKRIRELLGQLIDAQESERRRISRELHDDLSQKVATLSVGISRLKNKLPLPEGQLISELDQLREDTNRLTNEIRTLSHRLHPAVLEHLGLVTALESYVQSFRNEEQIDVTLKADIGEERVPFQTSICIYRVAVEALRNVSRHSDAPSAAVSLTALDNMMELKVSDSGKGFDVENAKKGDGLGLVSIEERLRLLQGTCEIYSKPGNGTTVIARVPISN